MSDSENVGAPEGVAHAAIVKALEAVPDVNEWDDVFSMCADVALSVLCAMPVSMRMAAMGMRPTAVYGGVDDLGNWRAFDEADIDVSGETFWRERRA